MTDKNVLNLMDPLKCCLKYSMPAAEQPKVSNAESARIGEAPPRAMPRYAFSADLPVEVNQRKFIHRKVWLH